MKYAWIENERVRDICQGGDPVDCYCADIANFYDTQVPDDADNGDGWINGQLVKPQPPQSSEPPARMWVSFDIRQHLTMLERVKWDNDKSDFIKTAKIELSYPRNKIDTTEVLQLLVDSGDISTASMQHILA